MPFENTTPSLAQRDEQRKKDCDLLVSRMKEMSAEWASAQQALHSKSYGDYMIDNPYKSDSTFWQDTFSNAKQEVVSLAPSGQLISITLASGDAGFKYGGGDSTGAAASGAGALVGAGEWYFSQSAGAASWKAAARVGFKRAGYVGAGYTAYSIAWDPYVTEMARQAQPDKIVNPKVTGLHGTITGAPQAIEFYSDEYNKLGCAEFYQ